MSVDHRGEHVEQLWLSRADCDLLFRAVEEMLYRYHDLAPETRKRLVQLSTVFHDNGSD